MWKTFFKNLLLFVIALDYIGWWKTTSFITWWCEFVWWWRPCAFQKRIILFLEINYETRTRICVLCGGWLITTRGCFFSYQCLGCGFAHSLLLWWWLVEVSWYTIQEEQVGFVLLSICLQTNSLIRIVIPKLLCIVVPTNIVYLPEVL